MSSSGRYFGTRITRRVIALFVVGALVPVAVALLLAYEGVQRALLEERTGLLRSIASGFAASLIDRLDFAEALSRVALADVAAGRRLEDDAFKGYFSSIVAPGRDGGTLLFGTPVAMPQEFPEAPGNTLVLRNRDPDATAVWLLVRSASGQRLAFELDPGFIWGEAEDLPYLTDLCVFGPKHVRLYCSRAVPRSALEAIRGAFVGQSTGQAAWDEGDLHYRAGFSELFLGRRYGIESWTVLAAQSEERALAPVQAVRSLVVPALVLGLLLAALLGLVQVRRTLGPLKELSEATARIAVQDFDVRVGVERDDEFGALARAFNAMSTRLGRQFTALLAHAEIDAVILSNMNLHRVAEIALRRIAQLVAAERQYLLLAEPEAPGRYRLYSASGGQGGDGTPVAVSETDATVLLAALSGRSFRADDPSRPDCLAQVPGPLFVLPIALGFDLGGAIILGYDDKLRAGEEIAILAKLCDRIAVALATARRDLELHRRAYYDALTQLPNRVLGVEELRRAVAAAGRHQRTLGVLFVDLDGFSDVNDSLGHEAGDQLLVQAAGRLRRCVRQSDVVARLGGDEFAVVLPDLKHPADASVAARHVIAALSEAFRLSDAGAFISASIGIALYPGDGATAEELLRHADLAMYNAKEEGRGGVAYFEASMNVAVRRRVEADRELRDALAKSEFELHYQPQYAPGSPQLTGAEALLRWRHPGRGLVLPGEFIGHAESSGQIEALGQWVLEAACAQYAAWRSAGLALERLSVNVSPRQFRRPGFVAVVEEALRRHDMPAPALCIEITESALSGDQPLAEQHLARLHQLGARLELDDFGTGYSSLARLQRLPVAGVKLDRSFIASMEDSSDAQAVVRSAIEMAHALGKYVVAEGVENARQQEILAAMGCDFLQGYHLGRPVPAAELAELMLAQPAYSPR